MIFMWSKSSLIGSKVIRWGLNEHTSHFALGFFEHRGDSSPVIESRLSSGVQLGWLGDFLDNNELVHVMQFKFDSPRIEADLFHSISMKLRGRKYDSWGILYWAYVVLKKKLFGKKIPLTNGWGKNEAVYCVEVMQAMPDFLERLGVVISEFDLEMTSPEMAFRILMKSDRLEDVTELFRRESSQA